MCFAPSLPDIFGVPAPRVPSPARGQLLTHSPGGTPTLLALSPRRRSPSGSLFSQLRLIHGQDVATVRRAPGGVPADSRPLGPRLRSGPAVREDAGRRGRGRPRVPARVRGRSPPPEAHTPLPQPTPQPRAPPAALTVSPRLRRPRSERTYRAGAAAGRRGCGQRSVLSGTRGRPPMARQDSGWAREEEEVLPRPAPPAGSHVGTERGPGAEPGGVAEETPPTPTRLAGAFPGESPHDYKYPAASHGGPPLPSAACLAPEGRGGRAERCLGNRRADPLPGTSLSAPFLMSSPGPRPAHPDRQALSARRAGPASQARISL